MALNLLFVCGKNLRRSPTAEKIFQNDPRIVARSAGTSENSRRKIRESDLIWADLVLCLERKYAARIKALYPQSFDPARIRVLDIPDEFEFMDPELIDLLQASVDALLDCEKR